MSHAVGQAPAGGVSGVGSAFGGSSSSVAKGAPPSGATRVAQAVRPETQNLRGRGVAAGAERMLGGRATNSARTGATPAAKATTKPAGGSMTGQPGQGMRNDPTKGTVFQNPVSGLI